MTGFIETRDGPGMLPYENPYRSPYTGAVAKREYLTGARFGQEMADRKKRERKERGTAGC